ncbi:hypothetical protein Acr_00g0007740 [Actinidia rufa]|uniref:Uncharacterized protein n=1 Tax=Actinidia rufa TaxID=165716 RepID=A0A7J0D8F3_9ERIC|nr:hypothetical protein Acr_00g0007740 [Actinidia rufa]
MEFNQAQLLVHDDAVLNKFRTDHNILEDPNAEGGDGMLPSHLYASLCQLRQNRACGGQFDALSGSPLQCCGPAACVYRGAAEEEARHTLLQGLALRKVTNFLAYEPVYCHVIPHKAGELDRIRLPALCIEGRVSRCVDFSLNDFSAELNENMPLARVLGWEEGITLSSSYRQAYSNLELGRQAFRRPRLCPALACSAQAEHWKPEFSNAVLGKQVTMVDSAKDHDTSLALAQAIMLPKDVANFMEEGSKEIRDLQRATAISERMKEQSTGINKSKKKISSLEKLAKLDFEVTEKAKLDFVALYRNEMLAMPLLLKLGGWLACLKELSIPSDHPAWSSAPLEVELVYLPLAYSPLVLLDFNEEKLLEEMTDEVPKKTPKVADDFIQDAVEANVATEDYLNANVSSDL